MKLSTLILLCSLPVLLSGQSTPVSGAMNKKTAWNKTYKGVLADFHSVTIVLSSDYEQVSGYIVHDGDQIKHALHGEWPKNGRFQLQERDTNDRLTGYLTGQANDDQLKMDWMSADQSRMFQIQAFPESLIRIKSFVPSAEWIDVASQPSMQISVQKMEQGIVSGIVLKEGHFSRFEGYCLDGNCTIWNTVFQNAQQAPVRVQMKQKDQTTYKVTLNGTDYTGKIISTVPLAIRKFDNSFGFLDFVYPKLQSVAFETFVKSWIDPQWQEGVDFLKKANLENKSGRLVHRSSGWIEIFADNPSFISGIVTYIHPGTTKRIPFVLLKKEDAILSMTDLINTPQDIEKGSALALKTISDTEDPSYAEWLRKTGYAYLLPTAKGVIVATSFDMIYGDDMQLLPVDTGKELVKRKYWKYFGW